MNHTRFRPCAFLIALVGCIAGPRAPASLAAQDLGLAPSDYYDLTTVGDVAVAPTGTYVAFTVTTVVESENRRHREIWLQRLNDGRPQGTAFRFASQTVEASGPIWSPDASRLGFTSTRGEDKNTIWFLRVDGPGGEAFHIEGVEGSPIWSPSGEWIAFVKAPQPEDEGPPAERDGWIAPDAISATLDSARFDGRVVTSIRYKSDGTLQFRPHYATRAKRQLFVVPATGGTAVQITDVGFDVGGVVWSANSDRLFFTGDEFQDDELNQEQTVDIWTATPTGGAIRRLTSNPGSETAPAISPDGDWIAYLSRPDRGEQTDLLLVGIGPDGQPRGSALNLTGSWDYRPGAPTWTADGTALTFAAGTGGNAHLFRVAATGGPVTQVTTGDRRLSGFSFSRDGNVMAYSATDAVTPTELFVASGDGSTEQRATGFNDGWLARVDLVQPERLTWTVEDGTEIEGWLVQPTNYQAGQTYPMILKIHGGPHSAYGNTYFPTFHVLSASGFFVLYTNPRGSSGYGNSFQYATRGQWGIVDREDYLTGVDAALASYPDIDPTRIGVSGGSYGGFMSNWLTATTDRFAASVTSRSITNWESWWGSSDAQSLTEYEFYGPPWEQRDLYRRLSPISYVENVTAPTLIIHSENDYRTPIADGEQWFMALKKRGVPVEMVRYPRSSHGLSRTGEPWLLVDRLERLRSWFVHWLVDEVEPVTDQEGTVSVR